MGTPGYLDPATRTHGRQQGTQVSDVNMYVCVREHNFISEKGETGLSRGLAAPAPRDSELDLPFEID